MRRAGYSQEDINRWKDSVKDIPARVKATIEDPQYRQEMGNRVTSASWWALVGTILSMAAAIGGALVGAGPRFRLLTRGAERPDSEEVAANPRAASARLRAAERIREAA